MVVDHIHQVVFSYLDSLDCAHSRLFVGFSGGVDSKVLLLACQAYCKSRPDVSIEAVHINHQLHPDADAWADTCVNFCLSRRLPYRVIAVDVLEPNLRSGLELRAREARHQAFAKVLSQDDSGILVLAHHAHDQWETILMRLAQGTGLSGLLGMRVASMNDGQMVVRPMLSITRQDCEEYLRVCGFTGIADSSNEDEFFTRGFIRKKLTPLVSSRWPQVAAVVSQQSRIWAQDFDAMDACVQQVLIQVMQHYHGLPYVCVEKLRHYPVAVRLVLLKSWLRAEGYSCPGHSKLAHFVAQIQVAGSSRCPCVIHAQTMLTVDRGRLFLLPVSAQDNLTSGATLHAFDSVTLHNAVFSWRVSCPDNIQGRDNSQWEQFSLINISEVWLRSAKSKKKLLQLLRVPWFLRSFYPAYLLNKVFFGVAGKTWGREHDAFCSMLRLELKCNRPS